MVAPTIELLTQFRDPLESGYTEATGSVFLGIVIRGGRYTGRPVFELSVVTGRAAVRLLGSQTTGRDAAGSYIQQGGILGIPSVLVSEGSIQTTIRATVTVQGTDGPETASDDVTFSVRATDLQPVANITTRPQEINGGETLRLTATDSDVYGRVVDRMWDAGGEGDLVFPNPSDARVVDWTAPRPRNDASYDIAYTVTDDDGNEVSATVRIAVRSGAQPEATTLIVDMSDARGVALARPEPIILDLDADAIGVAQGQAELTQLELDLAARGVADASVEPLILEVDMGDASTGKAIPGEMRLNLDMAAIATNRARPEIATLDLNISVRGEAQAVPEDAQLELGLAARVVARAYPEPILLELDVSEPAAGQASPEEMRLVVDVSDPVAVALARPEPILLDLDMFAGIRTPASPEPIILDVEIAGFARRLAKPEPAILYMDMFGGIRTPIGADELRLALSMGDAQGVVDRVADPVFQTTANIRSEWLLTLKYNPTVVEEGESNIFNFWTGRGTLTLGDVQYMSSQNLLEISGIELNQSGIEGTPKVAYLGVDSEIRPLLLEDPGKVDVEIAAVYLNAEGGWGRLPRRVSGILDDPTMVGSVYTFEVLKQSLDVDRGDIIYWTDEDHQRRHPGDRFFQHSRTISDGISDIRWPP